MNSIFFDSSTFFIDENINILNMEIVSEYLMKMDTKLVLLAKKFQEYKNFLKTF